MYHNNQKEEDKSTQTEIVRSKRTIFDTVLRLPDDSTQISSSPMPIVDQEVLLESLRAASQEGLINRQARSTKDVEETTALPQRQNDRGPLLKNE